MKFIRENKNYILSFIIPIIFLSFIYISCFCFAFQHNSIVIGDSQAQYVPLLSYFKDVLTGSQSIFYSFSKGLGGGTFGTFAYYLASPINLIIIFFSKANLELFFLIIILIKCGLCGLTMNILLSKENKSNNYILILLSTCYALSSFFINYYFNIMWLDSLFWLPLIMLGIDDVVKKENGLLYFISLAVAIFSNYYMGYMLCLFSLLYFAYKLIINSKLLNKKEIVNIIIRFVILSILSGLITSFLLVPTIIELQSTNRAFGTITGNYFKNFFSGFVLISKLFIGSNGTINVLDLKNLNLYCGLIVMPLAYFYFTLNGISKKEKICSGVMILILVLSIIIPHLNYIWHGFNFPNGLVNRFTFILIAFLILLASKALLNIKEIKPIHYLISLLAYLLLAYITIFQNYEYTPIFNIYLSCILVSIELLLLYLIGNKKYIKEKNLLSILLILFICGELLANGYLSYKKYFSWSQAELKDKTTVYQEQINKYRSSNTDFYRIQSTNLYSLLESFLLNYNGVSAFLSTNSKALTNFTYNAGISTANIYYEYNDKGTPVLDSLLGIKCLISADNINKDYDVINKFKYSISNGYLYGIYNRYFKVYINNNALSLGYMISDDSKRFVDKFIENNFISQSEYQNTMIKTMVNKNDDVLTKLDYEKSGDNTYKLTVDKDKIVYLESIFKGYGNNCQLKINSDDFEQGYTIYKNLLTSLPKSDDGNYEFTLTTEGGNSSCKVDTERLHFYTLNDDIFKDYVNELKQNQFNIDYFSSTYIRGTINVPNDKSVMFLSIPYEDNFEIYIDGNRTNYYSLYDSFIGIDMVEGKHDVVIKYKTKGLALGIIISFISLILVLVYFNTNKIKQIVSKVKVKKKV